MKAQAEYTDHKHPEACLCLTCQLVAIAAKRSGEIMGQGRPVKPAAGTDKAQARRERELHRELKSRGAFLAKLDEYEVMEYNPKTGRHYSLPKVLADAVLRPRGERSRDAAEFQEARMRQRLSVDEREELEGAIRAELFAQRARTDKLADILAGWYNVTPKWVEQFRIKRKGREIAKACRAGRAVLSYGMHGDKADSRTFVMVPMDAAFKYAMHHESADREPNYEAIRLSVFTKLAAHYAGRRGGRAHYRKDCALFRRSVELIVSARPARGAADMTPEDLAARLEKSLEAFYKNGQRMRERLEDGAARLAAKRAKRAGSAKPAARPVAALVDLPATLSECIRQDDATGTHTPFARAAIRADKGTLRRFSAHRASWPLAGQHVRPGREELVALQAFMHGAHA